MKEYNVYIDESGDEGINKGSKYFILTAIVVSKDRDLEISKSVDKLKENLEMNIKTQLHWKLLKGLPNKNMIMDIMKIVWAIVSIGTYPLCMRKALRGKIGPDGGTDKRNTSRR